MSHYPGTERERRIPCEVLQRTVCGIFQACGMSAQDAALLAAIFAASIEGLTGDDYGEAQQQAWAGAAEDEAAFAKRLASQLTLVATLQGSAVGFASLKGKDHIDLLYVHPTAVGQGVAGSCGMVQ